jgi:hypothetical protein
MLEPDASKEQIQLAYEMLCELPQDQMGANRGDIERAYAALISPTSREAYDRLETTPARPQKARFTLNDGRLLAACTALLVLILVFVWIPLYGSRLRSFSPGDQLTGIDGRPFGTIVQTDDRHAFPGGGVATGYLVELSGSRQMRWYPANDLRATCRRVR